MKKEKISKGYRLKPETHKMIKKIQMQLRGDIDFAVNSACRKFLVELGNNGRAAKNPDRIRE